MIGATAKECRLLILELEIKSQAEGSFGVGKEPVAGLGLLLVEMRSEGFGGALNTLLVLGIAQLVAELFGDIMHAE